MRLECLLWIPLDADFDSWVRQRYVATLAQALRVAMVSMATQVTEDDLAVDVIRRTDGTYELLMTELSPGGLGQAETIVREMQRQPRRFLDAFEFALSHCPREQNITNLLTVAAKATAEAKTGGLLAEAFASVRQANGFGETEAAKSELHAALRVGGFTVTRELVVAVVTKLLRPASVVND